MFDFFRGSYKNRRRVFILISATKNKNLPGENGLRSTECVKSGLSIFPLMTTKCEWTVSFNECSERNDASSDVGFKEMHIITLEWYDLTMKSALDQFKVN